MDKYEQAMRQAENELRGNKEMFGAFIESCPNKGVRNGLTMNGILYMALSTTTSQTNCKAAMAEIDRRYMADNIKFLEQRAQEIYESF